MNPSIDQGHNMQVHAYVDAKSGMNETGPSSLGEKRPSRPF